MDSFIIYTQPGCLYCIKAFDLLRLSNRAINSINVREDQDALEDLRANGLNTVPQIYHNGVHVGGYEDLIQYLGKENS